MLKFIIFSFILTIIAVIWSFRDSFKQKSNYLLISLFIVIMSFDLGQSIYTIYPISETTKLGVFGNELRIFGFIFVVPLGLLLGFDVLPRFTIKKHKWHLVVVLFSVISFINPVNAFPKSILVFLSYFFQIILCLEYIKANFKKEQIYEGIFIGLFIVTVIQTIIVIFYPVLGIEFFSTFLKGENALEYSLKRESYVSAIGIFSHPGPLALYCLICSVFFLVSFYNGYLKRIAMFALLMNLFIILLTFSRTTYVAAAFILFLIVLSSTKKNASIFTFKTFILLIFCLFIFVLVLLYSPLGNVFLSSDFDTQIIIRLSSWFLGVQLWLKSIWIGVGINSHVLFMGKSLRILFETIALDFLTTNPIHNIHMIILAETGILGFVSWLYFIFSRIIRFSFVNITLDWCQRSFNLIAFGVFLSIFIYGFFGWAPFNRELISIPITLCYFTLDGGKKSFKRINKQNKIDLL